MARFFQPKKNTSINKKHQVVSIDKLDHHGAGIAFVNKKPVFIDGALPGEQVLMQLTESKSKFARAQLIKVQQASEQRVDPFCPHYGECGGCDMQHLDRQAQLYYKQQTLSQLMTKFAGESLELSAPIFGEDKAYRRRARVSLWWDKKSQQLNFGFRQKQSKRIVNVTDCPVLESDLNQHLKPLHELLAKFERPDMLGHVELVKGANTTVLLLRHLAPLAAQDLTKLRTYAEKAQLALYLIPESNELIQELGDEPYYDDCQMKVPFLPTNFIQVNQGINQQMVAQALDWLEVSEQDRVLDLFCGLGNFSLPLAKQAAEVVGVEGVDEMVLKATENAQINQMHNIAFYQANLEEDMTTQPWARKQFDKILLDPARAGAAGIIDQLGAFSARKVVYVSCNPATLARDSQSLLRQGYELVRLGMLDMFPHTSHLESMALFIKK
ncbi:23S rRNA (uracil(1939)-C(5))-methyltransferase RlmD [Vibrio nitrifigilis]|uniref:23S rRNA (uracil(1939)-C(5))-methyltransferase RlmD n=1 Tax=Vibrio nitrifigilis TaxID=2789781 RepID=A0ABS0GH27_9VIBR|nr:23S rRNA (uracil(1939)-C(5))-methyltransferase RlmD [Vibrio nitrifigilis]MBF9001625.1 23S rRNA (uracil(1939)-C(5))-methyltransferase RlmD [Vibrio nitrifigilis]